MSEKEIWVKVYTHKYPRKGNRYSVWVCSGAQSEATELMEELRSDGTEHLLCLHPQTPYREICDLVCEVFTKFIADGGTPEILKCKELLP